jgi:hypothetical protein
MSKRNNTEPANIGWHLIGTEKPVREYILKGDWSEARSTRRSIERLGILDPEWKGRSLDCLRCFPGTRELRVLSEQLTDVGGIHSLKQLTALTIHRLDHR